MSDGIINFQLFFTMALFFIVITTLQYLLRLKSIKLVGDALRLVYAEKIYDREAVLSAPKESLGKWLPVLLKAVKTTYAPNSVFEALVAVQQAIKNASASGSEAEEEEPLGGKSEAGK